MSGLPDEAVEAMRDYSGVRGPVPYRNGRALYFFDWQTALSIREYLAALYRELKRLDPQKMIGEYRV